MWHTGGDLGALAGPPDPERGGDVRQVARHEGELRARPQRGAGEAVEAEAPVEPPAVREHVDLVD